MSKINIILYPRSYNKRGGESLHSVQGVTEDGRNVNIKLRLHESQKDNLHAPSISEFSREDIDASNPCQADPNNGPDNKCGILLFTDCTRSQSKGVETYEAKWGVVLANKRTSPSPLVGIGRMVINKSTPFVNQAKRNLHLAINEQNEEKITKFTKEINDPGKYSYPVIMYYPEDTQECVSTDVDNFKTLSQEYLSKYSFDGHTPGIMIRLVNLKGRIINHSYIEILSRYIASERRNQSPLEAIQHFLENIEPKLGVSYFSNPSYKIQIIPLLRVTSAVYSIKYYSQENQFAFAKNNYYRGEGRDTDNMEPSVCSVATRVSYNSDFDKMLLSRIYSLTKPLGHPVRMDKKGRLSLLFEDENAKLAQEKIEKDEINKSAIGLSFESLPTRAIWIIKGDKAPVIEDKPEDTKFEEVKSMVQHQEEKEPEETKQKVTLTHRPNDDASKTLSSEAVEDLGNIDALLDNIDLPIDEPIDEPIDVPIDEPIDVPIDEPIDIKPSLVADKENISKENIDMVPDFDEVFSTAEEETIEPENIDMGDKDFSKFDSQDPVKDIEDNIPIGQTKTKKKRTGLAAYLAKNKKT